jgi:hypothetical protein
VPISQGIAISAIPFFILQHRPLNWHPWRREEGREEKPPFTTPKKRLDFDYRTSLVKVEALPMEEPPFSVFDCTVECSVT